MSSVKWTCSTCTFWNPESSHKCQMCGTGSPMGPPPASTDAFAVTDGWRCAADSCRGFLNPTHFTTCFGCGKPQPTDGLADGDGSKPSAHACHVCTFLNDASAVTCAMCDSALRRSDATAHSSGFRVDTGAREFGGMFGPFDSSFGAGFSASSSRPARSSRSERSSRSDHRSSGRRSGGRRSSGRRMEASAETSERSGGKGKGVFKEVSEILAKEKGETERIRKEERQVSVLRDLYDGAYFVVRGKKRGSVDAVKAILRELAQFVPKEEAEADADMDDGKTSLVDLSEDLSCKVCLRPEGFGGDDFCTLVLTETCGHRMCCGECMAAYCKGKIKDEDVTPWIRCPAPGCCVPLHPRHLVQLLDLPTVYRFVCVFLRRHLKRNPNWIPCLKEGCDYGFVMMKQPTAVRGSKKLKCAACGKRQTISRDPVKGDAGFAALLKEGTLRLCPACEFPTMKDKGMCNVMHCGQCGIWWNWRTRESGHSYRDLKNKARMTGTLWEPGELHFQQQLQRSDPKAFKLLLERNGMEYDPSYVRGHG